MGNQFVALGAWSGSRLNPYGKSKYRVFGMTLNSMRLSSTLVTSVEGLVPMRSLRFKIASEPGEFEQISRLNYQTFVGEIPQHQPNPARLLVDKFHEQNTYIICLREHEVIGMIAIRAERPFSLDAKLEDLDSYLPAGHRISEFRLLSVLPKYRKGKVFLGLGQAAAAYCLQQGYDLAIISGTVKEQRLYRHLGFVPFGPLVGTPEAQYQPMYLTLESFRAACPHLLRPNSRAQTRRGPVNLLPGPVNLHPEVMKAFQNGLVSHRSHRFLKDLDCTKRMLCQLTGARFVELLTGTGTLANDVIAGQLSLNHDRGLILTNGEFGNRLVDHATRFGLRFEVLPAAWGEPYDYELIEEFLDQNHDVDWLWCVHCETSTGILNDLELVKKICRKHNLQLCVDCISSLGTIPVSLRDIHFGSGVSGKGLSSISGISMVFYNHPVESQPQHLPRYLDLGYYAKKQGIPFTICSNLIYALKTAISRVPSEQHYENIRLLSGWVRRELRSRGFTIIAPDSHSSPAVISIGLPKGISSREIGRVLEQNGYLVHYNSKYLLANNWIQICLFGACDTKSVASAIVYLDETVSLASEKGTGTFSSDASEKLSQSPRL